jgi:hypothetical protein
VIFAGSKGDTRTGAPLVPHGSSAADLVEDQSEPELVDLLGVELVSPVGIDLVQPSAKCEGARLMTSGRADSRRMPRSGEPHFRGLEPDPGLAAADGGAPKCSLIPRDGRMNEVPTWNVRS